MWRAFPQAEKNSSRWKALRNWKFLLVVHYGDHYCHLHVQIIIYGRRSSPNMSCFLMGRTATNWAGCPSPTIRTLGLHEWFTRDMISKRAVVDPLTPSIRSQSMGSHPSPCYVPRSKMGTPRITTCLGKKWKKVMANKLINLTHLFFQVWVTPLDQYSNLTYDLFDGLWIERNWTSKWPQRSEQSNSVVAACCSWL